MVFLKELFRAEKLWLAAEVGFDVYEGQGSQDISGTLNKAYETEPKVILFWQVLLDALALLVEDFW